MILNERGGLVVHPFPIAYYNGVLSTLTVITSVQPTHA